VEVEGFMAEDQMLRSLGRAASTAQLCTLVSEALVVQGVVAVRGP